MPAYNQAELGSYLTDLAAGPPIQERVRQLIQEYSALIGNLPEWVFIENVVSNEGRTDFTNLVLLRADTYSEFMISGPQNVFFCYGIRKRLAAVIMPLRHEMSFDVVGPTSRLTVQIHFEGGQRLAYFNAAGLNCNHLLETTRRYFLPNLL